MKMSKFCMTLCLSLSLDISFSNLGFGNAILSICSPENSYFPPCFSVEIIRSKSQVFCLRIPSPKKAIYMAAICIVLEKGSDLEIRQGKITDLLPKQAPIHCD